MSNPNPIPPIVYLKQNLCRWLARCWPPSKLKVWKVPVPDSEKKYCVQPEGALLSKSQVYWETCKFKRIAKYRTEVHLILFLMHDNMILLSSWTNSLHLNFPLPHRRRRLGADHKREVVAEGGRVDVHWGVGKFLKPKTYRYLLHDLRYLGTPSHRLVGQRLYKKRNLIWGKRRFLRKIWFQLVQLTSCQKARRLSGQVEWAPLPVFLHLRQPTNLHAHCRCCSPT